ncbi:MAG: glycine--tRNA ligase [Methanosphaera sp.]|uniref:glycine--tRNA ligase n=1 Tax=Methanosphaera sp. TaxID=2666342 RepID=UPI0025EE8FCE|nr:glycine--tRNA ligase [Methanosphaera sp.]MCI5867144.1 glycine--tRNA ligase [Methanosphaera sp.]MDD6534787.1 glycine--tRNA ligase [Methanosphaera sp.]
MVNEEMMSIARKRGYLYPSFEIYSGVAGFYDYGPLGGTLKNNIMNLWRKYYVNGEGFFEIEAPTIMPKPTLKASGHVDNFTDPMTKCKECKEIYRADHVIEAVIDDDVEGLPDETLTQIIKDNNIVCESCGGELDDVVSYNLMFKTQIGASGKQTAFMRPETAQGIFIAFKRISRFYKDKLPFGIVQLGKSYRNELSPRQGVIRLREFTQAEAEIFVDPSDKTHAKFESVADHELKLYSQKQQQNRDEPLQITAGEAVDAGIISSETIAYQITIAHNFLHDLGIGDDAIRFRQHLPDEMAHYAIDCWDAEVKTDQYGWVEIIGIADRTDFDLKSHIKHSKEDLSVFKEYDEPKTVTTTKANFNMKKFGPTFKGDSPKAKEILENTDVDVIMKAFEDEGVFKFTIGENEYEIDDSFITFKTEDEQIRGERIIPHVIEPSYGIDRIIYSTLLHSYTEDENDEGEKRAYLKLPAKIAPIKAAILPLVNKEPLVSLASDIEDMIRASDIITTFDVSGTIGRRYARGDEIGIPYAVTVDYDSIDDEKVTIRNRDNLKQKRVNISDVADIIKKLVNDEIEFDDI